MYVVGGTIREMEPDGLVQLRGGGLRERAMVAPFRGGVLSLALARWGGGGGGEGAQLLANGEAAAADTLLLLSSTGEPHLALPPGLGHVQDTSRTPPGHAPPLPKASCTATRCAGSARRRCAILTRPRRGLR